MMIEDRMADPTVREYAVDLLDRGVKTAAQSAVLAIGAESLHADALAIDWSTTFGFALGGFVLSVLTNLAQRGITGRKG